MDPILITAAAASLEANINRALKYTQDFIGAKCAALGNAPQEPDFVAGLTIEFTRMLGKILELSFPAYAFSVTGVYCHQKPLADIGLPKSPELGDLLLVYIYTDPGGVKYHQSLLLQAKITTGHLRTAVPPSDMHQLALYEGWPKFTYARAGSLNGTARDVVPKTLSPGGQYLLIDPNPATATVAGDDIFPMATALPQKILSAAQPLAREIVQLLGLRAGRSFEKTAGASSDDWTRMIWELLLIAGRKASKRKNAGLEEFPRLSTHIADGLCSFITSNRMTSIYADLHRTLRTERSNITADNFFDEENFSPAVIVIESSAQVMG